MQVLFPGRLGVYVGGPVEFGTSYFAAWIHWRVRGASLLVCFLQYWTLVIDFFLKKCWFRWHSSLLSVCFINNKSWCEQFESEGKFKGSIENDWVSHLPNLRFGAGESSLCVISQDLENVSKNLRTFGSITFMSTIVTGATPMKMILNRIKEEKD